MTMSKRTTVLPVVVLASTDTGTTTGSVTESATLPGQSD
jgi:hypothetical protein